MSPCPAPVPLDTLTAYWLGDLPAPLDAETEAHLMGCTGCARRAESLAALGDAVRDLVGGGRIPLVLTRALLRQLERQGVRIRHHHVEPGGHTACTAGPDDDLIGMAFRGAFRPDERVDLIVTGMPGIAEKRHQDVPVDHDRGEVLFVEPADLIRSFPAHVAVARLDGVGPAGRRTIGEYVLRHTPWPGPR
jgi:hypothetical protein